MQTVLVTGAGGFLGRHLCECLTDGFRVIGVDLNHTPPEEDLEWVSLSSAASLADVVSQAAPDVVVHAAFNNRKPRGWSDSQYLSQTADINNAVFEAVASGFSRLVLISSSAVYGSPATRLIDEKTPASPVSLYGLAKQLQENIARYYGSDVPLCILRLFNLCGPGQRPGMLLPDWVHQARDVCAGHAKSLRVPHVRSSRDFVDARDAARAIRAACDSSLAGTYNVASGKCVALREIAEQLIGYCPLGTLIHETADHIPANEPLSQCGCYAKLKKRTGWSPQISWQQSLDDLWQSSNCRAA